MERTASSSPGANGSQSVLAKIAELSGMDQKQLRQQWSNLMVGEPPASRSSILQQLIYRVQEMAFGGLSQDTRQKLVAIARNEEYRPDSSGKSPVPGTKFYREWRGKRYEITVTEKGFVWEGRPYRSLSAVAKAITGQHWNGKLFFGLTQRKR